MASRTSGIINDPDKKVLGFTLALITGVTPNSLKDHFDRCSGYSREAEEKREPSPYANSSYRHQY